MSRKPNVACLICGTQVYRRPGLLEESQGRAFCSQTCYGIFCRKEIPCVTCGAPILSGKNTKTCSKPCFEAFSKTIDRGFSIGRKPWSALSTGTRTFKKRLREERGGACEVCGYDKVKNLVIHHIVERSEGGSDDPSNLLLLCPNCHGEIHQNVEGPALERQAAC